MAKKLSRALLIPIVLLILAGCTGAPAPTAAPAATSASESTEAPAAPTEASAAPTEAPAAPTEAPAAPTEAPAGQASPTSKTFTVAWTATDVTTFDPHVGNSTDATTFIRNIYESLVAYKYGTFEIEGRLAESWEVSDDGLNWTFKLREGATFADGSPVTPEDVVYSFDRLNGIGKGPSFVLGGAYVGAEVVDDRTVTVKLNRAVGPFLSMLPRVFIVNSKVVKEHATDADPWAEEWMYDHDAGSGPFMLEEWEHGVQASVVRNPNYWNPVEGNVERFVTRQIPERATDRLLLENGEVDTVLNAVLDVVPEYKANPDLVVYEDDTLVSMQIVMNTSVPPLDDVRVRKAIALAFDYEAMVEGVYQGFAVQAQGPLARNMKFHDDSLPVYQQDLEQARALLEEAGYADGGLELELLIVQGQPFGIGASQILQQGLAEIGVNLKITELAYATLFGRVQSRDNPAQMYTWYTFPSYPDPDAVLYAMFHSSQQEVGQNGAYFSDPEVDALLERGRSSTDEAEREEIYKELQQRIFEAHPAIWLVNPKNVAVFRNWVKNYEYDPAWHQTYRVDQYMLDGKP